MNHIYDSLPEAVEVDGRLFSVNTDFRLGVKLACMSETGQPDTEDLLAFVYKDFYLDLAPQDPSKALEACLDFYSRKGLEQNNWQPKSLRAGAKSADTFSYDYDTDNLVADFQREYGLDITSGGDSIHWWRFVSLISGLSDSSIVKTIGGYRAYTPDKADSAEERKHRTRLKNAFRLPPKTKEEALRRAQE